MHIMMRYLFAPLFFISLASSAQHIVLNSDLAAHSEELKVKMGSMGGNKIWKFRFGEYAVGTSKRGWETTHTKTNFWGTKSESSSSQKFSFQLLNNTTDTAYVNASKNVDVKTLHELSLIPGLNWGIEIDEKESENFFAYISLTNDSTVDWVLYVHNVSGASTETKTEAFMTGSSRRINIIPATSNKNGEDKRSIPAVGYEFEENGKTLGALQYYGGGMMGSNKNIVWLHSELDSRMKLLIAAAMTAILQFKN